MFNLTNLYFAFYLFVFVVWIHRSRIAFDSLEKTPLLKREPLETDILTTVIVPAKNEEKTLPKLLDSLDKQTHKNLQILIVNDHSTDGTEDILKSRNIPLAKKGEVAPIAYLIPEQTTPEGWTGKNHAIHSAIDYAQGEWFLFLDADTVHTPESIASALHYATRFNLPFLSLLPRCMTESFLEATVQPVAMGFLGLWFPLSKVNQAKRKEVFANGQYLMMRKDAYQQIGGHETVKGAFLEDFALMREAKKHQIPCQTLLGTELYGTHMYDSFKRTWKGWRRIYLHAFEQNPRQLLSKLFGMIVYTSLPFLALFPLIFLAIIQPADFIKPLCLALLLLAFVLTTAGRSFSRIKTQKRYVWLLPVAAFVLTLILMDATWMAMTHKKTKWR